MARIEIEEILCPVDLSEQSRRAFDHGVMLARWYGIHDHAARSDLGSRAAGAIRPRLSDLAHQSTGGSPRRPPPVRGLTGRRGRGGDDQDRRRAGRDPDSRGGPADAGQPHRHGDARHDGFRTPGPRVRRGEGSEEGGLPRVDRAAGRRRRAAGSRPVQNYPLRGGFLAAVARRPALRAVARRGIRRPVDGRARARLARRTAALEPRRARDRRVPAPAP